MTSVNESGGYFADSLSKRIKLNEYPATQPDLHQILAPGGEILGDSTTLLPEDVWGVVCKALDVLSLLSLSMTCKKWHKVALNLVDSLNLDNFYLGLRPSHLDSVVLQRSNLRSLSLSFVALYDNNMSITDAVTRELTRLVALRALNLREMADSFQLWRDPRGPNSPWNGLFAILPSMTQLEHLDLSFRPNAGDLQSSFLRVDGEFETKDDPSCIIIRPISHVLLHGLPRLRTLGLTRVDISGWNLMQMQNQIECLKLARCDIRKSTFSPTNQDQSLPLPMTLASSLRFLILDKCSIAPDALINLSRLTKLEGFTMFGVGFPEEALRNSNYAHDLLGLPTRLQSLRLKSTQQFDEHQFTHLIARLPCVEILDLPDCVIRSVSTAFSEEEEGEEGEEEAAAATGGDMDADAREDLGLEEEFSFAGPFLERLTRTSWSLSVASWMLAHCSAGAFEFRQLTSLTSVWIDEWPLDHLISLAPNLSRLNLDFTAHFEEFSVEMHDAFVHVLTSLPNLRTLELSIFGLFTRHDRLLDSIAALTQLDRLVLNIDSAPEEVDYTRLILALTNLTDLTLKPGHPITQEANIAALASLGGSLRALELRDVDPELLAPIMSKLTKLETVVLSSNSDSGLSFKTRHFRTIFENCHQIRTLKVDFKIIQPGVEVIAWRVLPNLLIAQWGSWTRYRPVLEEL